MIKKMCHIIIAFLLPLTLIAQEKNIEIPGDSLTVMLYDSFISGLDSAASYTAQNDFKKAVRMYSLSFDFLKQFNEKRREHAAKYLAEVYETEQKEQRILFLDEELPLKEKQNFLLIIFCVILVGMFIASFVYLKYHLRNILQNTELKENENRLMELEKEERLLENRLHTMEVEKYQKELLAESLVVNHKNKVLADLHLFLVQNPMLKEYKTELESILGEQPSSPISDDLQLNIDEIHPAFYARLQEKANNKLTSLDMEYCRMIYMNMSSKEMADVLGVDPKTVRISKYRLKRKLGLDKEDDLSRFIENTGKGI